MVIYIITSILFIFGGALIGSMLNKHIGNPKVWGGIFYIYGGIMGAVLSTIGTYIFGGN